MLQIVLLTFDGNVRTVLDQGGDCLNIFLKLADNADSGNVFHFLFHALHGNMLALHFLQDAGHAFHAAAYLLDGGIQIIFSVFADNVFKFDDQFLDRQFVGA